MKNLYTLTPKEQEVYKAIVEKGIFINKDLCRFFCISESTLNSHLGQIYQKTNTKNKAELVYRYYNEK